MADNTLQLKFLFIINPHSGSNEINFKKVITEHFQPLNHQILYYELPKNCPSKILKAVIDNAGADRVIAVGGDGTLKLVAGCLLQTNTPIGIIPAGSANGMAKELKIPQTINEALEVLINGTPKKIHVVIVNDELCIHLADIGFNAYLIKQFGDLSQRGMWGYAKAAILALWNHHKMEVEFKVNDKSIRSGAAMVVIANATMYGTGVKINPEGKLDDDFFEVILVKKYAVMEILKLKFTHLALNPKNITLFKVTGLTIKTKYPAHFQIDGEYMGKVNQVKARILPAAISIIV